MTFETVVSILALYILTLRNAQLYCQVSQLVAQLFQMRVRMKNLMGVMEGGSMPTLSNLEEALKTEEKVIPFSSYTSPSI